MTDPTRLSAATLSDLMSRGEISSRELVQACLARVSRLEPSLSAQITVCEQQSLAAADEVDRARRTGERLPALAGIPVVFKDNICTEGVLTTAGSRILGNFIPPFSATVAHRVRAARGILLAKSNMDEFGMGSSTENSAFYPTRNPWDIERVPGGSSGGSAAAVASFESPLALGSDTGGSVRQPASLCGVVGLKPTYGRVSRYGLVAYASSLDQIGPLSRTVEDCALLLGVIAGFDPNDATTLPVETSDYIAACGHGVAELRIGVPDEYFSAEVDPAVRQRVLHAIRALEERGARVDTCSLPATQHALAAYYVLAPAECSSNLARYDGVRYGLRAQADRDHVAMTEHTRELGLGAEVKQRIMLGAYALSAGYYDRYYRRAQQVRSLIRREFARAFQRFDLLAGPTSPVTAFRIGERSDPLQMKLADICTVPANMAGIPSISVPCGLEDGLPVGLQLMAPPFQEARLFAAAACVAENCQMPPLSNVSTRGKSVE